MLIIKTLDKKPTGVEIEKYVESMVNWKMDDHNRGYHNLFSTRLKDEVLERAHEMACSAHREMSKLKELMDYLGLEFKDEPARRIVVKKDGSDKKK